MLIVVICVFKLNAKCIIRSEANNMLDILISNWQRKMDLESLEDVLTYSIENKGRIFKRFDIKIKELHGIRPVNESGEKNWINAHSAKSCVINRSNLKQQGQTSGYKKTITQTKTVTVTNTGEISGTVKIPNLPLLDSFSMKLTRSKATADMQSEAIEISAPSQKVDVNPHSKVPVSYKLHTYEKVYNYLLDFEIDESSTFVDSPKKDLNFYANLLFRGDPQPEEIEHSFLQIFDEGLELKDIEHCAEPSNGISFRYVNGKYILKNFPMTYRVSNAELNVVFGNQVELSSWDLSTSSDDEIRC